MLSADPQTVPAGVDVGDARLAAAGDARAFERLYRGHVAQIHALARRMAGAEDAAELTQEVFVRAWEKLGTFRGESAFGTWLHRLAVNLILSRRAARTLRRSRFEEGEEVFEVLPSRAAGTDQRMDFETAIGKLPEGARQIFVLHDVEGYKHQEIAALLRIASGTSKAQLHRARMMLRQTLHG
ncbi:MAG TPA: RNA polymerase sigma factor [Candidatus Eisenbacteria bacterium]|jgi:RNA polymerase sigma-70 factor (ECF subfamily)